MQIPTLSRYIALPIGALLLVSCGSTAGPGWTYAPLGPTPSPATSVVPTAAASGTPSGSSGAGVTLEVATNEDAPMAFVPAELQAPAGASVTVNYMNNSSYPHNINFFNGPDQSATSLGATKVVTGPNAPETLTFTAPAQPGDYLFWCDVHTTAMKGILHVQ